MKPWRQWERNLHGGLSEDLRKRIVVKRNEGYSTAEVSMMFKVIAPTYSITPNTKRL